MTLYLTGGGDHSLVATWERGSQEPWTGKNQESSGLSPAPCWGRGGDGHLALVLTCFLLCIASVRRKPGICRSCWKWQSRSCSRPCARQRPCQRWRPSCLRELQLSPRQVARGLRSPLLSYVLGSFGARETHQAGGQGVAPHSETPLNSTLSPSVSQLGR